VCFYHAKFSNLQKDIQFQKICTKKYILVEKSVRNVQRNYVYFIAKLKDHYTKKKTQMSPHQSFEEVRSSGLPYKSRKSQKSL
jgi:hypothetical protein